jgi:hypothetical protein
VNATDRREANVPERILNEANEAARTRICELHRMEYLALLALELAKRVAASTNKAAS